MDVYQHAAIAKPKEEVMGGISKEDTGVDHSRTPIGAESEEVDTALEQVLSSMSSHDIHERRGAKHIVDALSELLNHLKEVDIESGPVNLDACGDVNHHFSHHHLSMDSASNTEPDKDTKSAESSIEKKEETTVSFPAPNTSPKMSEPSSMNEINLSLKPGLEMTTMVRNSTKDEVVRQTSKAMRMPSPPPTTKPLAHKTIQLLQMRAQLNNASQTIYNTKRRQSIIYGEDGLFKVSTSTNNPSAVAGAGPGDKHPFIIRPLCRFRIGWDTSILLIIMYTVIMTPFKLAFDVQEDAASIVVSILFDVVFLFDVYLNFNTAIIVRGHLVFDRKKIIKQYLTGAFIIDAIASVPVDLIITIIRASQGVSFTGESSSAYGALAALKPLKMIRLVRLVRLVRMSRIVNTWILHVNMNPSIIRIFYVLAYLLLVIHITGCIWFSFGWINGFGMSDWGPAHHLDPESTSIHNNYEAYITSVYWAFSAILSGIAIPSKPEMANERIFTIIMSSTGVVVMSTFIGSVASLAQNMDVQAVERQRKLNVLYSFFATKNISYELRDEIKNYLFYLWTHGTGSSAASTLLEELPQHLRAKLAVDQNISLIKNAWFFQWLDDKSLEILLLLMNDVVVSPGDFLVSKGDHCKSMYFIKQGELELILPEENVGEGLLLTTFSSIGSFVLEEAVLSTGEGNWECPFCIRAKSFCELLELPRDLFNSIVARNDTNILMKDEIAKIEQMRLVRRHQIQSMQNNGKMHLQEISLVSHDLDYLGKSSQHGKGGRLGHIAANTMRMLKHHHHKKKIKKLAEGASASLSNIRLSFSRGQPHEQEVSV